MIHLRLTCFLLLFISIAVAQPTAAVFEFINTAGSAAGLEDTTPRSELDSRILGDNEGRTLGEIRRKVFEAAGESWGRFLLSDVTIRVDVNYVDQGGFSGGAIVLASAGPRVGRYRREEPLDPNTVYPFALADSLAGFNINTRFGSSDIGVNINSNAALESGTGSFTWYYGLDGNAPQGTVDLVETIAHELGHGLGFSSLINLNPDDEEVSVGQNRFEPYYDVFTRKIYDQSTGKNWTEMTDAERALSAKNDPHLVFDGDYTNAAIEGVNNYLSAGKRAEGEKYRIRLHAPAEIRPGSSVSHWSSAVRPGLLMESSLNSVLSPDLDLSPLFMKDIGWQTKDIAIPHLKYDLWKEQYEFSEESGGPSHDHDSDGLSNLAEYFHGSDPTEAGGRDNFLLSIEGAQLSYQKSTLPNDLRVRYESSAKLLPEGWTFFTPSETTTEVGPQRTGVEAIAPALTKKEFYRLDFSLLEETPSGD